MKRLRVAVPLLAMGLVLLFAAAGCDEDTNPCEPAVPAGRIQGYVRTGGLPVDAEISVTRIVAGPVAGTTFTTVPDDGGFYSLDLPAGRYTVALRTGDYRMRYVYAGAQIRPGDVSPDTVNVDASLSPRTIDFNLGSLVCEFNLSESLSYRQASVALYRRDGVEAPAWLDYFARGSATIANGSFRVEIAGVLPGEYRIAVFLGLRMNFHDLFREGERFWLPGTRDRSESPWYTVEARSVLTLNSEITTEPARLEGRITGAWRDLGLTDVPELSIVGTDSTVVLESKRVAVDGRFAIDILLPEPVKLLVTHQGVAQWIGGPGFAEATVYSLQAGETISEIEQVQSGLRLSVNAGDIFVDEVEFRIHDASDLRLLSTTGIYIGDGGDFGIANLWPGDFLLHITPTVWDVGRSDLRPQWFDRTLDPATAHRISIAGEGEIVHLQVTLERGGEIHGRVEPGEGPPAGYCVIVTPAGFRETWGYVYQFSFQSTFEVRGLPDGEFKVGAWPIDFGWTRSAPLPEDIVWYPGTTDWDQAGVLEIRDANSLLDIVIPGSLED